MILRSLLTFSILAVASPLVGFDLGHTILVPLALGAGLVAAATLAVGAKGVSGMAFAWTCALVAATVAADVIKVQVLRIFGGINGWLLVAGVVISGAFVFVAHVRAAKGVSAKANKPTTRTRAAVVEGDMDGSPASRPSLALVDDDPDTDEREPDELGLFGGRTRRGE